MEREAEYYEVAGGGNVVCRLCPVSYTHLTLPPCRRRAGQMPRQG